MHDYINTLSTEFQRNANPKNALAQKAYLKNKFEHYGLKTPDRRSIQKTFLLKDVLPPKSQLNEIVRILWNKDQREYHYFAQELVYKYKKQFTEADIQLFEYMVENKSWWDTVDFIATKLIGTYFKMYPDQKAHYVNKWLQSNHLWLQRSAIIFQLKYKDQIDIGILKHVIHSLLGSKEFFINKAIGWVLREYSKTNPDWVLEFVRHTALNPLSQREALRLMK